MSATLRRQVGNSSALALYAALAFVVLTLAAMWLYPGGATFDLASTHYQFFGNFFSDLGATRTPSGRGNLPSVALFALATTVIGLAMINFSGAWRAIHARRRRARPAGVASQVFLVLAGVGFIGIAATPWDHLLAPHMLFVKGAFAALLGHVLAQVRVQVANHWPRRYLAFNALYLIILAIYVGMLFVGPSVATPEGLAIQVAAQKVIVYASMGNFGLQALGVRGHLSAL